MNARDIGLAVFAAAIWGGTYPLSAFALETTPPIFFAFLRFLFAASFVFFIPRPHVRWENAFTSWVDIRGRAIWAPVCLDDTRG